MGVLQLAVVVVVAQGLQAVLWTVPRMRHLALHWVPAACACSLSCADQGTSKSNDFKKSGLQAARAVSQSRQPTAAEAKLA